MGNKCAPTAMAWHSKEVMVAGVDIESLECWGEGIVIRSPLLQHAGLVKSNAYRTSAANTLTTRITLCIVNKITISNETFVIEPAAAVKTKLDNINFHPGLAVKERIPL